MTHGETRSLTITNNSTVNGGWSFGDMCHTKEPTPHTPWSHRWRVSILCNNDKILPSVGILCKQTLAYTVLMIFQAAPHIYPERGCVKNIGLKNNQNIEGRMSIEEINATSWMFKPEESRGHTLVPSLSHLVQAGRNKATGSSWPVIHCVRGLDLRWDVSWNGTRDSGALVGSGSFLSCAIFITKVIGKDIKL